MTASVIVSVLGLDIGGGSSRGGKLSGLPPQAEHKKIITANPNQKIFRKAGTFLLK